MVHVRYRSRIRGCGEVVDVMPEFDLDYCQRSATEMVEQMRKRAATDPIDPGDTLAATNLVKDVLEQMFIRGWRSARGYE